MIYTIGYQALTPEKLKRIVLALDAQLIDCRSSIRSRIAGFGGRQLEQLLGAASEGGRYEHWPELGGRTKIKRDAIAALLPFDTDDKPNCVLMCMEQEPWLCHRHHDIVMPHFPHALHVYQNGLYTAEDIAKAIVTEKMPASRGVVLPEAP
jgi:uncharacterized protein (DUF488 family)